MKNKEKDYSVSKRLWSKEQDELLLRIIGNQISPKWIYVSQEFNERIRNSTEFTHVSRTNKQCRQRWQNHLNPTLKNNLPWTDEQHKAFFRLFKEYSHQWCELAGRLQTQGFDRRGENNIKNYFYSAIKRQIKRINEVIRQSNKQTKRKKSYINQYQKIYGYKPRYSIQRQILASKALSKQKKSQQLPGKIEQNKHKYLNEESQEKMAFEAIIQKNTKTAIQNNLHIIKQLDYELISKILLVAEEKGGKKFVISSNLTKQYHQEAEQLRNQLIQLIIQRQQPIENQYAIDLAVKMLKMSRKCKRKTQKMGNEKEENYQVEDFSNKKRGKQVQKDNSISKPKQENFNFNIFDQIPNPDKFYKIDDRTNNKPAAHDFMRNSQQFKMQQGHNNPIFSSLDSGFLLMDSRNFMNRSNQFGYNSNFFDSHNLIVNNPLKDQSEVYSVKQSKQPPNNFVSSFINSLRQVHSKEVQVSKPVQYAIPHSNIFSAFDYPFFHSENNSLFSSQPINNTPSPQLLGAFKAIIAPSNQNKSFSRSWAYPYDQPEPINLKSLHQNMIDDQMFRIPAQGLPDFSQK